MPSKSSVANQKHACLGDIALGHRLLGTALSGLRILATYLFFTGCFQWQCQSAGTFCVIWRDTYFQTPSRGPTCVRWGVCVCVRCVRVPMCTFMQTFTSSKGPATPNTPCKFQQEEEAGARWVTGACELLSGVVAAVPRATLCVLPAFPLPVSEQFIRSKCSSKYAVNISSVRSRCNNWIIPI